MLKRTKKLTCVTLCVAVILSAFCLFLNTALTTSTVTVRAATVTEQTLDFNTNDGDAFDTHGDNGWAVSDGVYKPVAAGAITKTKNTINLSSTVYVSFDFYADACPFDVFFTKNLNDSWSGVGAHIYSDYGGVFTANKNLDRNDWLGDYSYNYVDGKAHNLKIKFEDKQVSFYMDGSATPLAFNGGTTSSFSIDGLTGLTDNVAQIVFRASSTTSYIDNLKISASDITYVAPVQPSNDYTELNLDFSKSSDVSYFATPADLTTAGWHADGGKFYPTTAWAITNVVQPIDLTKTTYISFNFLAGLNVTAKTGSQFNVAFLPDLTSQNGFGIHAYYSNEGAALLTANKSLSRDEWIADSFFPWDDCKEHNLIIKLDGTNKKVTYYIDGAVVEFGDGNTALDIPVTQTEVYLAFQSSEVMSCIDDFTVSESEITYVAPTTNTEFEEFTTDFTDGSGFTAAGNGGWKAENGVFSPNMAWSTAQYEQIIPLDGEKTVQFTFKVSEDDNGSQFNVGIVKAMASGGAVPSSGLALHLYKPESVQLNLSYSFGNPFDSVISTKNVNYFDGNAHTVKLIVKDKTLAVVIDTEIIFKDIPLNMDAGYFTVQSTSVLTEVKSFSIKNVAESINIPDGSGDIAYEPEGSGNEEENEGAQDSDFGTSPDKVKIIVAIVCGVVAVGFAVATVIITLKIKKNKKEE